MTWPYSLVVWEDFSLPRDEAALFLAIQDIHARAKAGQLVEIACDGGTGRTGTTLACLAILAGVPPEEAIIWMRANYHTWAVEVPEQQRLVSRFAAAVGDNR